MRITAGRLLAVLLLVALVVVVIVVIRRKQAESYTLPPTAPAPLSSGRPISVGYRGCPAEGNGGDIPFNRLKNRIDSTAWTPTPFSDVIRLGWPRAIEKRWRSEWGLINRRLIGRDEGRGVAVEGYFAGGKEASPEAVNCHRLSDSSRDWHIWLVGTPGGARSRSIVVEATPAVRERHARWDIETIRALTRQRARVRVSGWLLMDPEHPDQLNRTRGTLWEIHPVMAIEVDDGGTWVRLDDYAFRFR